MLNGLFMPVHVSKNPCLAWRPSSHLALSLPLDFSIMDSIPLDFSIIDSITLGTFFRSFNTSSVPVPFPQTLSISNVHVPSWFVSHYSPNFAQFVLLIVLVETLWFAYGNLIYFVYYRFSSAACSRCIIRRLFCTPPRLVYTTLCFQNKFTASFYHWVFNIFF